MKAPIISQHNLLTEKVFSKVLRQLTLSLTNATGLRSTVLMPLMVHFN